MRALIFTLLCTSAAVADRGGGDVDEEVAKRHFAAGQAHYAARRYGDAIREFEAARRIKPVPAFDYNIARCYDMSEQWRAAADAYERYLAASPKDPETARLRERIKLLRDRAQAMEVVAAPVSVAPAPTPAPVIVEPHSTAVKSGAAPRPLVRQPWLWATVAGAVVVVGLSVGLGVGLGANRDPTPTYGRVFGD